jgi:hypothetical protein
MTDLFETPREVRKNPEKVRTEVSGLLNPPTGKGKSGSTGLSLPGRPGKSEGLPFTHRGSRGREISDVHREAARLRIEIEKAEVIRATAESVQAPFHKAFSHAHAGLELLWLARRNGTLVHKQQMLRAYDARVAAGHAWNPHRTNLRDAERWLKALRSELTNINMELDR